MALPGGPMNMADRSRHTLARAAVVRWRSGSRASAWSISGTLAGNSSEPPLADGRVTFVPVLGR